MGKLSQAFETSFGQFEHFPLRYLHKTYLGVITKNKIMEDWFGSDFNTFLNIGEKYNKTGGPGLKPQAHVWFLTVSKHNNYSSLLKSLTFHLNYLTIIKINLNKNKNLLLSFLN